MPEVVITADIPGHGRFQATGQQYDILIRRYLPASPRTLRTILAEDREAGTHYDDVYDVSALLLILGELDGLTAERSTL